MTPPLEPTMQDEFEALWISEDELAALHETFKRTRKARGQPAPPSFEVFHDQVRATAARIHRVRGEKCTFEVVVQRGTAKLLPVKLGVDDDDFEDAEVETTFYAGEQAPATTKMALADFEVEIEFVEPDDASDVHAVDQQGNTVSETSPDAGVDASLAAPARDSTPAPRPAPTAVVAAVGIAVAVGIIAILVASGVIAI